MNGPKIKVLLVEDSPSDASLLIETLRETAGDAFEITAKERLDEALRLLGTQAFDVMLLDLCLPDSTGVGTIETARAGAPHLAIVLLTGLDDEVLGGEALRQGVQDYLIKGHVGGRQIARAIRYAIERKRSEEALREMEGRLRQIQKMESLEALAGGIAHDFNNLLMVTLGHTELAQTELPPDSPVQRRLREILSSTQRAAELSRQMLAYAGGQLLTFENLDLSRLIQQAGPVLEALVPRNARLLYRLAEDLPPVLGDVAQMGQVLRNLVVNAAEAIGDAGGTVTLATGAVECDRATLATVLADRYLPSGRYVCLEVSDTGCGMDHGTLDRAFDPFFSTKFVGRGLGLAVVQGIVRSHKGAIAVKSELGRGATFRILLPSAKPASRFESPPPLAAQPSGRRGTVLLAEDDETVRHLTVLLLNRLGYSALPAADGRQAVELFQAHRGNVVCVILDLAMPLMGGIEVLEVLRRLEPALPALISSGFEESRVAGCLRNAGEVAFIQKPYQIAELSEKLQALLSRHAPGSRPE